MIRTLSFVFALVISCALLSGCNTARGVGQDIRGLGNAIERAVD
ncbi:entericidin A/B family lipoprotein [Enterobacteriaceae bacterium 4M9]|nr:entericidin A/B family lipoprotein [Enterobacteriaceae bacterium 4M9]